MTGQGQVASSRDQTTPSSATLGNHGATPAYDVASGHTGPHSTGAGVAGLAGAGGLAAGAGAVGGSHGHHSGVDANTKNDTHGGPEDLTIGGFNPKVAGTSIPRSSSVHLLY